MIRRLAVVSACAAVAFVGAVPTHASPTSGCATLLDLRGDAVPDGLYQPPAAAGVDLHTVSYSSDVQRLVTSVTVGDIAQQPASSTSTRLNVYFAMRDWSFTLFYRVTPAPSPAAELLEYTKGIEVAGRLVSQNVQASVVGNTVTLSVDYKELQRIVQRPVRGERLTQLGAESRAYYAFQGQSFDTVDASRGVAVALGAACRKA